MIYKLIKKFPKKRPALDSRIKEFYQDEYLKNRNGENIVHSLANKLESWMHKKIAYLPRKRILEIGAGTLNHLSYESRFKSYDIVEPFSNLYQNREILKQVDFIWADIQEIKIGRYDKILSIATLEHVQDLPKLLAKSCFLLKSSGVFQVGIPAEGGFLWGLTWRITTGLEFFLRTGLNYKNLMRHEHINSAKEIELLCKWLFRDVKIKYFPIYGLHFSWYIYLECRQPQLNRAREILK